jgi:hypothetical protein
MSKITPTQMPPNLKNISAKSIDVQKGQKQEEKGGETAKNAECHGIRTGTFLARSTPVGRSIEHAISELYVVAALPDVICDNIHGSSVDEPSIV